jgi:hypothetical protein
MNGNPKFSEKLWEWRSFSKTFHKSRLNMIHELPVKFDYPTEMTDNYVCTPDCNLNIKLRYLNEKVSNGLEELVTVEISHLAIPEDVSTLSVEHARIDKVIAAIPKIMRDVDKQIYRDMIFMNYLQAVWGLGKKIFD